MITYPKKTYPYAPQKKHTLWGIAFFSLCAFILGDETIHFHSSDYSRTSLALMTLGSIGFVLIGLASLTVKKKAIILDETHLRGPKSFLSKKVISIPYNEVLEIGVQRVKPISSMKLLEIISKYEKYYIQTGMMPDELYQDLISEIEKRTNLVCLNKIQLSTWP